MGVFISEYLARALPNGRVLRTPAIWRLAVEAEAGFWDGVPAEEIELPGDMCIALVKADETVLGTVAGLKGVVRLPDALDAPLAGGRAALDPILQRAGLTGQEIDAAKPFDASLGDALDWVIRARPAHGWIKDIRALDAKLARGMAAATRPFRSGPYGTPQITDFSGIADQNPLSVGGRYAGPMISGGAQLRCLSGQVRAASTDAGSYYATALTRPCEYWYQVATWPSSDYSAPSLCIANPNSAGRDNYYVFYDNGSNTVQVVRVDNGSDTSVGTSASVSPANGWHIAIAAPDGSTIEAWHSTDGTSWTRDKQVTDATYQSGFAAMFQGSTTARINLDGGGAIGVAAAAAVPLGRRRSSLICR
jgi:hypothetical protein